MGPHRAAFIALGANLGDRAAALRQAVRALDATSGIDVRGASPVYASAAHTQSGAAPQPDYLNAVVEVATTLAPEALLDVCLQIEQAAGRDREKEGRWGARLLDIDVLLYGTETRATPRLTIPHPRMAERRFVLQPLADLAPNFRVPPPFDATVRDLLAHCPDAAPLTPVDWMLHA